MFNIEASLVSSHVRFCAESYKLKWVGSQGGIDNACDDDEISLCAL